MKKNKTSLFFVFCALILSAFCFLAPMLNKNEAVNASAIQVVKKSTLSSADISVNYADKDFNLILKISGFTFEIGDVITYYYLNTETTTKYTEIDGANPTTITSLNLSTAGEFAFAPSILGESSTYKVMATVYDISTGYTEIASPINIEINKPEDIDLYITYEIVESQPNALRTYKLSATIKYNNVVIDSSLYEIRWYIANVNDNVPFANRISFEWTPTELGTYTIRAEIDGMNDEVIQGNNTLNLYIAYDNSLTIIIGVCALAVVMTTWVIIATVIRVKKERIW